MLTITRLAEKVLQNVGVDHGAKCASDLCLRITDHGKFRYPLRKMLVGEHFFVPNRDGRNSEETQNSVSSSVCHEQKVNPTKKFKQRRYPTGVRVWRIR